MVNIIEERNMVSKITEVKSEFECTQVGLHWMLCKEFRQITDIEGTLNPLNKVKIFIDKLI